MRAGSLSAARRWAGRYWREALLAACLALGAGLRPVAAAAQRAAIAVAPQYGRSALTLYFGEAGGRYLIPVARRVAAASELTPLRAVEELLRGPQAGPELRAVFPADVALTGVQFDGRTATVALSGPAEQAALPAQAVQALVLALTELPAVQRVALRYRGQPIGADGQPGAAAAPLTRPAVNPEAGDPAGEPLTLYFAYGGQDRYLVPVMRWVEAGGATAERAALEFLRGPAADSGLQALVPGDVRLRAVRAEGGVAVVDFSEELIYAYRLKQANALEVRKSVIGSLTQLPGLVAGKVEIAGSPLLLYTCQNAVMEFPQAKPWAFNDEFYLSARTAAAAQAP